MLVKTEKVETSAKKPEPIHGRSGFKGTVPVRCTQDGELLIYQVNNPLNRVGHGVNHKNKDGILVLGDDGNYLRNLRVDPDGTLVTRIEKPEMPSVLSIQGTVRIENEKLDVNPVTVTNIPSEMRIAQEFLQVKQAQHQVEIIPVSHCGHESVIIDEPCLVRSIFLAAPYLVNMQIQGITGAMYLKELRIEAPFPSTFKVEELKLITEEWVSVGGYVICERSDNSEG